MCVLFLCFVFVWCSNLKLSTIPIMDSLVNLYNCSSANEINFQELTLRSYCDEIMKHTSMVFDYLYANRGNSERKERRRILIDCANNVQLASILTYMKEQFFDPIIDAPTVQLFYKKHENQKKKKKKKKNENENGATDPTSPKSPKSPKLPKSLDSSKSPKSTKKKTSSNKKTQSNKLDKGKKGKTTKTKTKTIDKSNKGKARSKSKADTTKSKSKKDTNDTGKAPQFGAEKIWVCN